MDLSRVANEEIYDPPAEEEERGTIGGAPNDARDRVLPTAGLTPPSIVAAVIRHLETNPTFLAVIDAAVANYAINGLPASEVQHSQQLLQTATIPFQSNSQHVLIGFPTGNQLGGASTSVAYGQFTKQAFTQAQVNLIVKMTFDRIIGQKRYSESEALSWNQAVTTHIREELVRTGLPYKFIVMVSLSQKPQKLTTTIYVSGILNRSSDLIFTPHWENCTMVAAVHIYAFVV